MVVAVAASAAACLGLSGCVTAPPVEKPDGSDVPASFKAPEPWREVQPADHEPKGEWWSVFRDAELSRLQKLSADASPGARAAFHRVEESRATVRIDRAELFPSVFTGFRGQEERGSDTASTFASGTTRATIALPLDLEYEIDLWGRIRRQVEAAEADAAAAEADYRGVLLSLQTDLALLYFRLRTLDAEKQTLDEAVAGRKKALDLVNARFKAGDVAELDVAQAETELSTARAEAIGLERERRQLENGIAVLCGSLPSDFRLKTAPLSRDPAPIPGDFPSDLLERRPDVAAAERAVAAAGARVGAAKAAFFPSVRIGGGVSLESRALNLLFSSASGAWGYFGNISQPVFTGGALRARLDQKQAVLARTGEEYRLTVLSAVRDVEDALSAIDVLRRQAAAQAETVASARRTVEIAEKRYASGLVAYFEVVDAQRALLDAERGAVRLRGDRHAATVALVKALGGKW
jgi:multidrug efflux system outer membrane protein